MRLFSSEREASTEVPGYRGNAPIVNNHHMIEEDDQETAIEAFLVAHEDHTQDLEVQRGKRGPSTAAASAVETSTPTRWITRRGSRRSGCRPVARGG